MSEFPRQHRRCQACGSAPRKCPHCADTVPTPATQKLVIAGMFESRCAFLHRMATRKPHGCVGHVCQVGQKCSWRAYPGAYLGIRPLTPSREGECDGALGRISRGVEAAARADMSQRDTCSRGERDVELTCANGPRQRPTLTAQAPTRLRRSAARADAGCLVDDRELSLEMGVRFGECEPSSS